MGFPASSTSNPVVFEEACSDGVTGFDEIVVVCSGVGVDSEAVDVDVADDGVPSVPGSALDVPVVDPFDPVDPAELQPASPAIAATAVPRNSALRVLRDIRPSSPTVLIVGGRRFLAEKRPGKVSTPRP